MNKVFVYGSLKQGHGNNRFLSNSNFIGKGITLDNDFKMVSLGGFPGLIYGDSRIVGELYEIDNEVFQSIDRLEGNGHFYKRELIEIMLLNGKNHKAWIYVLVNQKTHYGMSYSKEKIYYHKNWDAVSWKNDLEYETI